jgi:hypothetical protein
MSFMAPVNRKNHTFFHSKFEIPPKSKIVSLEKLDNFYIGRFYIV